MVAIQAPMGGGTPTPTPTASPSPTATATASPSPTPTATATFTPTPTATATFTPTPTPTSTSTPTPCIGQYMLNQIGGSIVPGTTDIGNHGDDTVTTIACHSLTPCTTRASPRSICRPTAMPSSRPLMRPSPTNACRGSPTTSPSTHIGTTFIWSIAGSAYSPR